MLWILKKITDRLKTLLVANAALDLEAEFITRHIGRRAELLQTAKEYEKQGFDELAEELRGRASQLSIETPFSAIPLALEPPAESRPDEAFPKLESSINPEAAVGTARGVKSRKPKNAVKTKPR